MNTNKEVKNLKKSAGFTPALKENGSGVNSDSLKLVRGFTLIEILVVIGIIAILAAIVIIAINPAKQFAQARNTQRQAGVNTILNAVGQRLADNRGIFAGSFSVGSSSPYVCGDLPTSPTEVTTTNGSGAGQLGCLVPTYVASLPLEPNGVVAPATGYQINVDGTGRVTVCAPQAVNEGSIPGSPAVCVTR